MEPTKLEPVRTIKGMHTVERLFSRMGIKHVIQVKYGIRVTNHRYFSVTATIGELKRGRKPNNDTVTSYKDGKIYTGVSYGCQHDEVLKFFPSLADLVAVHLADADTGQPMYALENGFYWFKKDGLDHAARYLRLTDEQKHKLSDLMVKVREGTEKTQKEAFTVFVNWMKPIRKKQADELKVKYSLV